MVAARQSDLESVPAGIKVTKGGLLPVGGAANDTQPVHSVGDLVRQCSPT